MKYDRETVDDGWIVSDDPLYKLFHSAWVITLKTIVMLSVWYICILMLANACARDRQYEDKYHELIGDLVVPFIQMELSTHNL